MNEKLYKSLCEEEAALLDRLSRLKALKELYAPISALNTKKKTKRHDIDYSHFEREEQDVTTKKGTVIEIVKKHGKATVKDVADELAIAFKDDTDPHKSASNFCRRLTKAGIFQSEKKGLKRVYFLRK